MDTVGYKKPQACLVHFGITFRYDCIRFVPGLLLSSGRRTRGENRLPLRCRPARNVRSLSPVQEHFQQVPVELSFGGPHDLRGARMGKSRTVRARRRQSVIYVRDAKERAASGICSPARPSGYPFPSQRSWWFRMIALMSPGKSMSATSSSPACGCLFIIAHSSSVSLPGLFNTSVGTMIFPMSWSSAPIRNQKSERALKPALSARTQAKNATRWQWPRV